MQTSSILQRSGVTSDAPMISGWSIAFIEDPVLAPVPDQRGFQPISISFPSILAFFDFQLYPASRGFINVYSDDPSQYPKIEPNLFSDPNDIISWRTHLRSLVSAFQAYDPSVILLSMDNATLYDGNLFEEWLLDTIDHVNPLTHSYGTARLASSAATGAIDPEFRVFGAKNLRVCDTQAFPAQTDGNPSYAAMALGHICADTIPAKKKRQTPSVQKKKRVPKPPKNIHHNKRDGMTQQDYQKIVAFFASVKTKMSMADAMRIIRSIQATKMWRELEAQYGPYQGK